VRKVELRKLSKQARNYIKNRAKDAAKVLQVGEIVTVGIPENGAAKITFSFGGEFYLPTPIIETMPIAEHKPERSIEDMEFEAQMVFDSRD
jgi:hypothetical protein